MITPKNLSEFLDKLYGLKEDSADEAHNIAEHPLEYKAGALEWFRGQTNGLTIACERLKDFIRENK